MNDETTYTCIRPDHSPASEFLHVSPILLRCGPPRRGNHAEQRLARTLRTDARHDARARRVSLESEVTVALPVFLR